MLGYFRKTLQSMKQYLIGDLLWEDIYSLYYYGLPSQVVNVIEEKIDDDLNQDIVIKNLGILGKLVKMPNFAYMARLRSSTLSITDALKTIDGLPNSRKLYSNFETLTDTTPFITQTGSQALGQRKKFIQVLPSARVVCEISLRIASKMFLEEQDEFSSYGKDAVYTDIIVRRILVTLFLGCDLTPEINDVVERMTELLLNPQPTSNPSLKIDYKNWVHKSINEILTGSNKFEFCSLAKIIRNQINTGDLAQSTVNLNQDPLIHSLFTIIITADNVGILLDKIIADLPNNHVVHFIKYVQHDLQEHGFRIGIDDLDANSYDMIKGLDSLENLFQYSLYNNSFNPHLLPRYIEHETELGGQIIPSNTKLFIHHSKNHAEDKLRGISYAIDDSERALPIDEFIRKIKPHIKHNEASPFSVGSRMCPGKKITEVIFKATVCMLASLPQIYTNEDVSKNENTSSP